MKFGWKRDLPDVRDYNIAKLPFLINVETPDMVDLRNGFTKPYQQGELGSCTANAASGVITYLQKKTHNKVIEPSRLFLYKTARKLQGLNGDSGSSLRGMMGAIVLFGAPPETYMPYNDKTGWDEEPTAFHYAIADNFEGLTYVRLDLTGQDNTTTLNDIKATLASGLPAMFGFTVYDSFYNTKNGIIPFPSSNDTVEGGHAVVACGYDDTKKQLLIRNSWGNEWGGMGGYLWMPYKFVTAGLTADWWVLTSQEFVDQEQFL